MALSVKDIRNIINKKKGDTIAFNLLECNPTKVVDWISTNSRLLDSIIARDSENDVGVLTGVPAGKIIELAGLEATGKSFLAAIIAGNAQKKGYIVIYFESEMAIDPIFWISAGVDVEEVVYIQAQTVEFVFETMEQLLKESGKKQKFLFIWDSLPFTPTQSQDAGDYNPQAEVGKKPRVISLALSKLLMPLANKHSSLIVINQLKTNIPKDRWDIVAKSEPYFTPGGKSLTYAYSLRLWLTRRKAKSAFVFNENGDKMGAIVSCQVKKSRFGTEGRTVEFKLMWRGDAVGIADEESWFNFLKEHKLLKSSGAWWSLEGHEKKFYQKGWLQALNEDSDFKTAVIEAVDRATGVGHQLSTVVKDSSEE